MAKPQNFAGIPGPVLSEIMTIMTPPLPAGVTPEIANEVLMHLVWEENAAAHPGDGTIGIADGLWAFMDLGTALEAVKGAKKAQVAARIPALVKKIDALTENWKFGTLPEGFFTTTWLVPGQRPGRIPDLTMVPLWWLKENKA